MHDRLVLPLFFRALPERRRGEFLCQKLWVIHSHRTLSVHVQNITSEVEFKQNEWPDITYTAPLVRENEMNWCNFNLVVHAYFSFYVCSMSGFTTFIVAWIPWQLSNCTFHTLKWSYALFLLINLFLESLCISLIIILIH